MSLNILMDAIDGKKLMCPLCKKPVQKYEKFVEMTGNVWDGAGDSNRNASAAGSKVTLICGNDKCDWRERTEYWQNYIE